MRKISSILFTPLFLLSNIAYAQFHFLVNASTDQELNNNKVLLTGISTGSIISRDSATVRQNKFNFKGAIRAESVIAVLRFISPTGKNRWFTFVLDTGTTNLILKFNSSLKIINVAQKSLSNQIHENVENIRMTENLKHRITKNNKEVFIPLNGQEELALDQRILDTLTSYPNEYYSLRRMIDLSKYVKMVDQEESLLLSFNKLSNKLKSSSEGLQLLTELHTRITGKRNSKVGSKIIAFNVQNTKGSLFSNYSLIGSPYLIVFSATWCLPCQEQLPKLLKLYDLYQPQGLNVVYFNLDDQKENWLKHVDKNQLPWINVSEGTKFSESFIAKQLHITHIPTYIMVNESGMIILNSDLSDIDIDGVAQHMSSIFK